MRFGPLIDQLMEAFQCLPGVGPKSAQRMTLHLLERDREGGEYLSAALARAIERVGRCKRCRNLSEDPLCPICASARRDQGLICVVETPADVFAVEQAGGYAGLYFVLLGRLSPIDGIGPAELGLDLLGERAREEGVKEVILATNPTVEGEATAVFISKLIKPLGVHVTRLAYGVPVGSDLEYADEVTLSRALEGRREI